ncbi:hypothetical protein Pcinc_005783 [Petrolisthes cinctipes]|uniref:Uncharacterized protein n=1 Tax=Petrolisthes cinctipes TaxID=88211 RepID=A0AAE1GCM8_PETCI|nr:hypothetical protein Pcinc_005783 [Petrolisthes cinctipes]
MTRLHFTLLLVLLPFSSCEVSGERLMVDNQVEQMEELHHMCHQQGTKCADMGGRCYHKDQPREECKVVEMNNPDICEGNGCYCCVNYDEPSICNTTTECMKNGVDPGKCVDDVQAYIDRKNYYVSGLKCEHRDCFCVHRCQEEILCQKFEGHCSNNKVRQCRKGYTMLAGCGCKNVETCSCCVPDAMAKEAAAAMGC